VRAVALAQAHMVAQAVAIPLVGMGGVQRGQDALDLMRAGAQVVAVGTENFRDPAAALRINSELDRILANREVFGRS
jgi:dihydroorotate dehydrogenase (NAD+) catalytic subunit